MITSIQNPRVRLVRDLIGHSRERLATSSFVAEGIRLIEEALNESWKIDLLLYSQKISSRGRDIVEQVLQHGGEVLELETDLLNRISDTEQSQGLLAVIKNQPLSEPELLTMVLILDSVRDPGNVGTILRTAAAAGVQTIWMSPDTADPFSPKVLRAGMGAQFRIPIRMMDWTEMMVRARENALSPYLSEMEDGSPLWTVDMKKPIALVVSNEANGATPQGLEWVKDRIHIPMPGKTESLNVSVAAGILLFEVVRQRAKL